MDSIRVDGCNLHIGMYCVVSFTHHTGPILGFVGRLKDHGESQTRGRNDPLLGFEPWAVGGTIWIHRSDIDRVAPVDGPLLST